MTSVPKHIEIRNFIAFEIIQGRLNDGDKLFSRDFFIGKFKVNPSYIEKAYLQMMEDGFLEERSDYYYLLINEDIKNMLRNEFINKYVNEFLENMALVGYDLYQSYNFLSTRINANG